MFYSVQQPNDIDRHLWSDVDDYCKHDERSDGLSQGWKSDSSWGFWLEERGVLQPNLSRICQGVDLGSNKIQIMQVLLKINVIIYSISVRFQMKVDSCDSQIKQTRPQETNFKIVRLCLNKAYTTKQNSSCQKRLHIFY